MREINGPQCRMGYKEMLNTALTHGAYSKSNESSRLARMAAAYSPKKEVKITRKMQSLLRREAAKIWAYLEYVSKNEATARLPEMMETEGYQVSGTHTRHPKPRISGPKKSGAFKQVLPKNNGDGAPIQRKSGKVVPYAA